ncbi:4-hydroxybenzoate polyprenyltransferase [Oerskovia turbata]|uniref:4-hydroxybenzoate polyprenyltransferase n=1 Tax=Oerskovia turbata TaxID=1713 RepID=A0A4Q1L172_9CELL|nr:UbiA family prenyltransferase [Oerskovia turbata]RXR27015.1 4-hydroxybenzoate polyprenyltransferase [Oerskovia turbata]RXR36417.1 4-hydroxybenzoate polyprenyltransferase [Oerskovia turbata]
MTLRDYLDLVRAPAVLSVLGDTLAGAAAGGRLGPARRSAGPGADVRPWRLALLPLSSACLYAGGMALNDYADRELDALERPERPLPSGRVSPAQALGVASGLTVAGLALAGVGGGRRSFALAVPLAASVWTYDLVAKNHATGPVVMAACRGLDVLMGAGAGRVRAALPAAAALTVHTAGVTVLSRGEVHGTTQPVAAAVAAGTVGVAVSVTVGALRSLRPRPTAGGTPVPAGRARAVVPAAAALVSAGVYVASCLPKQVSAVALPDAAGAFTATKAGIRAMVPLQAALAARGGSMGVVAVLAGVEVAGRALRARGRRRVSPNPGLSES